MIAAKGNGSQDSNEIEFILTDTQNNVYAVKALRQFTGSAVITLSNGDTVARILPNETFVSDWVTISVPTSAPLSARVAVGINFFHYALIARACCNSGQRYIRDVNLEEPPYYGAVTSITPSSSIRGSNRDSG